MSKQPTMLERTRELTNLAREEAAEVLLAREQVELAIRKAAAAGAGDVTIPSPLKIKSTAAATGAAEWLTKAGFRVRWAEHRPTPTGPAGDALVVEW